LYIIIPFWYHWCCFRWSSNTEGKKKKKKKKKKASMRVLIGGIIAMGGSFGIGKLFN